MGLKPKSEKCPICEKSVQHVNNHVRMCADDPHGGMGQYPDGWDKSKAAMSESDVTTDTDPTQPTEGVETVTDEPDEPQATDLELDDHKADARIYQCTCGEELVYHANKCPQCDEPKQWRSVA